MIHEYKHFRSLGGREEPNPLILLQFERVLFAMRDDVGLSNKGLLPGDLLSVFLIDPEVVLKQFSEVEQVPAGG